MPFLRRCAYGFLLGGLVVATGLLLELLLVALTARPNLWLGRYPWLLWMLAFGSAGAVGVGLAGVRGLRRDDGAVASLAGLVRRDGPLLALATATALLVGQVNQRFLPGSLAPQSLAVTAVLVVVAILLGRWIAGPLGRVMARALGTPRRLLTAIALSLALPLGLWLFGPRPPRIESVRPWEPPAVAEEQRALGPAPRAAGRRLLVVGLDGARWEILEPWIEAGRLPNLASLVRRGRRGVLRNPDLQNHTSPVAWTTIFTGFTPEEHGIDGWVGSHSRHRRKRPLWSILDRLDWRTYVVNVPASYPADRLRNGGMLAGEPVGDSLWGTSHGWWLSTRAPGRWDLPIHGPLAGKLLAGRPVTARLHNDADLKRVFQSTLPGQVLQAVLGWRHAWTQRLVRWASPSHLEFELRPIAVGEKQEDGLLPRLELAMPGESTAICEIASGFWGPWLEARAGDEAYWMRPRLALAEPWRIDLSLSPLFRQDLEGLAEPARLRRWVQAEGEPYVVGGDSYSGATGSDSLVSLQENALADLARRRAAASQLLMRRQPWDAWIHVFTVPDRAQHFYWPFFEPDAYPEEERPEESRRRRFGKTIQRVYEAVDRQLGQLVAGVGRQTTILVVSDHGAQGGAGLPFDHHEEGIYLLVSPLLGDEAAGSVGPTLEQVDIAPLLLAHLELPASAEWPGTVPPELLPRSPDGEPLSLPEPVATFEIEETGEGGEDLSPEALERLRALGYLDG